MGRLRFGLIGAGAVCESHVTAITRAENAELTAICKKSEHGKKELEEKYSVPCLTSLEEMLPMVDSVDIITPNAAHMEPALEAMRAGKHTIVEKPMEITPGRIDRMIEASEEAGVKLACVFQLRFSEPVRELKKLIDGGILGKIYSGSAYCKLYRAQEYYDSREGRGTMEMEGGGCLMQQGLHNIDLLLWLMGDAEEIIGATETAGRKGIDVETLAGALLRFKNGASGVIESTTLAYPGARELVEIFGFRGTVTLEADTSDKPDRIRRFELTDPTPGESRARDALLALQNRASDRKQETKKEDIGKVATLADQGHTPVLEDFIEAIRTGREPFIPGAEARRSVEVVTSVYESAAGGSKPVRLG